jgi:osmoprotectant transport system permease protein
MVQNRVLLILVLVGYLALLGFAFVTLAANRLVSGTPIGLAALHANALLLVVPGALLTAGPFLPQRRAVQAVMAAAAAALLLLLVWLAGAEAATLTATAPPASRVALGGAFWGLFLSGALALDDALGRLALPPAATALAGAAVIGAVGLLVFSGALDSLAILREYAGRREVFAAAVVRHALIVAAALLPAVLLGVPLGVLAQRRPTLNAGLFPLLNVVQTIPSIALFGLLIAPLSALAAIFPRLGALGIGGVGVLPAVIALILYSLLPITRNTAEGLAGVSPAALEAGRGLGMTRRQLLWRVEMPLALPIILSGLRVAAIQAVGLTAVAALIGAGGLGAIMFQGLFADALDLVLLGVIPIVLLALAVDWSFQIGIARAARVPR